MTKHLDLAPGSLDDSFPNRLFYLTHDLSDHPLLQLPRLVELCRALPADKIEYNSGKLQPNQDPFKTPRNGLSAEETIRRIETCDSWLGLRNIELDDTYRAFMDEVLDGIEASFGERMPKLTRRRGFIFISSPNAVTPYHHDPEYNILVQARGRKTMYLWDSLDTLSDEDLESWPGKPGNLTYRDEYAATAVPCELSPGQALFVPYAYPHWVKNGNEVSISMSFTWQTPETDRLNKVSFVNAALRRAGLPQRRLGTTPIADGVKALAYDVGNIAFEPIRRSHLLRQFVKRHVFGEAAGTFWKTSDDGAGFGAGEHNADTATRA
jgi:hypothetical protein